MVIWSLGPYDASICQRKHYSQGNQSLQLGDDTCSRGAFTCSYSFHPYIVGIVIHLEVLWCTSCHVMVVWGFGLMSCLEMFGGCCYVVSMESVGLLPHVDVATYYVMLHMMLMWFPLGHIAATARGCWLDMLLCMLLGYLCWLMVLI